MHYKNIFLTALFIPLCMGMACAQNNVDSLLQVLHKYKKENSVKADIFDQLGRAYTDSKEKLAYSEKELSMSEKIRYDAGVSNAIYNMTDVYRGHGDIANALAWSKKGLDIFKRWKNEEKVAEILTFIGNCYIDIHDFPKAIEVFKESLAISKGLKDEWGISRSLSNISNAYAWQGEYKKSIEAGFEGLKYAEKVRDSADIIVCYSILGNTYEMEKDYLNALDCFQEALSLSKFNDSKLTTAGIYRMIGRAYVQLNDVKSMDFFQKSLSVYRELDDEHGIKNILTEIAVTHIYNDNFLEAEKYLNQSLLLARKLGFNDEFLYLYGTLSTVDSALGKFKEAYEMQKLFKQFNDSLYNNSNTKKITQLQMQFDFDKKQDSLNLQQQITYSKLQQRIQLQQSQLALASKEKELQKLAGQKTEADFKNEQLERQGKERQLLVSERDRQLKDAQVKTLSQEKTLAGLTLQRQWFFSIGAMAAICLGFLYFFNRNRLKQVKLQAELVKEKAEQEKKESQFQRSLADISLTALRSQMNPHFIFNCLNSIKLYTTQNDIASASEYLTKFSKLIRQVMENSRNDQIPLAAELEALTLYLEMEAMRFKNKLQYRISVAPEVDANYTDIPPLLLQPYVENAIWHGLMPKPKGGNIDVDVRIAPDEPFLIIQITDDGIGRHKSAEMKSKTATKHKSYGMKVTSERLALINEIYQTGASVTIEDLIGADGTAFGTRVTIKTPLE